MKQLSKKHKKIKYSLLLCCILGFLVACTVIVPVVYRGYHMYRAAVAKESIVDKVEEIKSKDNYVKIDQISEAYLEKLVASEDTRFYSHKGIDYIATARAMYNNIKAGCFKEGGSTITQQLAKNMYFSFEKKLDRKVAELFVAKQLESLYTKEEILELYCNVIYFGEDCYGINTAANHYYGVDAKNLSSEQVTALVRTIKSPNNYNPNACMVYSAKNN